MMTTTRKTIKCEVEAPHKNCDYETERISPYCEDTVGMKEFDVDFDISQFESFNVRRKYVYLSYKGRKMKLKKQSFEIMMNAGIERVTSKFWDTVDVVDDTIDTWEEFKSLPSYKVLKRIMEYIVVGTPVGEWQFVHDLGYDEIAQTMLRRKLFSGPNLFMNAVKMIKYVSAALRRYRASGEIVDILHSGRSYQRWYTTAMNVKRLAPYLSNLEPHGLSIYHFIRDLNECLDQGTSIYKSVKASRYDDKIVSQIMNDLRLIKANFLTKSASMKERRSPIAFLVYGNTGVAKSQFTKLLYTHYAKTFDLPAEDNYRYVRLAVDKHWNNFGSHMWCVQLDDIAFMHPNKAMSGDPSVMEILQIINNVPFVPTQAAIEDKGKTPMFAKLVVGTTNTPHLNAQYYFANYYAVRRRFPYMIRITPKEHLRKGDMIDTSKIPEISNEYPDFWIIEVKKVRVETHNNVPQVMEDLVHTFDDIYTFLAWYSKVCIEHEKIQDRAQQCEVEYKRINLCKLCYHPDFKCICNFVDQSSDYDQHMVNRSYWKHLLNSILGAYVFSWLDRILPACVTNRIRFYIFACMESRYRETYFYKLGETVRSYKISREMKLAFFTTIVMVGIYIFYRMWKQDDILIPETTDGCKPLNEVDKPNFYKNDYEVTQFDVPVGSCSTVNMSRDEFIKIVSNNLITIRAKHMKENNLLVRDNKALCLRGNIYVVNTHFFEDMKDPEFTLIQDKAQHINGNFRFVGKFKILKQEGDLTYLRIDSIPPKKDITNFIPRRSYRGVFAGFYISRSDNGSLTINDFSRVKRGPTPEGLDAIFSTTQERTRIGFCGSVLIMETPSGFIMAGLHGAALQDHEDPDVATISVAVAYPLTSEIIKELEFSPASGIMKVESGSIKLVKELHRKSPLCETDGYAYVYGSLKGYVSKSHSRVKPTPINQDVKELFNKEDTHGPPVMGGNQPWKIALAPTLKPSNKIDSDILDQVVKDFTNEILTLLPKNELDLITPYDWDIVVNGKAGVQYVDKINTASSMGWPWNKSKKYFLHRDINSSQPMGVTFPQDIWDKVESIENSYRTGTLVHPVFRTNLKDEPLPLRKIKSQKTRVFTSCPIDWCLVVRKWTLPIIRVIQRNRFIFEAQPGIVAQSTDWEELHKYLCSKGPNYFAGDYENYDKRLPPALMRAGFQIMRNLAEAAGQHEMSKMIACICSDSIYPFMVYKSEVIQAFGSLPSGVPVTAILNSLVGSLIMRYAYAVLKKEHNLPCDASDFKRYVALVTYGDDNAAGVSNQRKWFNHVNVSRVLRDQLDLVYTMADKEAESVPFIDIEDVTFLKRSFRWDSDYKAILGPLDPASLFKMLTQWIPSKTVSQEQQMESVAMSCMREAAFHGKETYEFYRRSLREILEKNNIPVRDGLVFPDYDILIASFLLSSKYNKNFNDVMNRHNDHMRSMINDRSVLRYTNLNPKECDLPDSESVESEYAAFSNLPERSSKLFLNKVSAGSQLDKGLENIVINSST